MSDAVKLAREVLDTVPNDAQTANRDCVALARAVIAQDEELVKLRAAITKAADDLSDADRRGDWKDEVADLRKLVTP